MAIIVGLDPSSGSKSLLGIAAYDTITMDIVLMDGIEPDPKYKKNLVKRVKELASIISEELSLIERPKYFFIESTVMKNIGGESLARATGAFMINPHYETDVRFINNGTVKKAIGGHGKAEKPEVAAGVLKLFAGNKRSVERINQAIKLEQWDQLDALAIALAGYFSLETE